MSPWSYFHLEDEHKALSQIQTMFARGNKNQNESPKNSLSKPERNENDAC